MTESIDMNAEPLAGGFGGTIRFRVPPGSDSPLLSPYLRVVLTALLIIMSVEARPLLAQSGAAPDARARIEGLVYGSVIGDAAGGPTEFAPPVRSGWTTRGRPLDAAARAGLADRFRLSEYTAVDEAAPYGPWRDRAPAGTVTDDTRFKILFMRSLDVGSDSSGSGGPDGGDAGDPAAAFAREIIRWHDEADGPYGDLPRLWLDEFALAARWVLGERNAERARPPERQWGGIATMAGQMPFLPAAALTPGDPESAYMAVWRADFLDNGWGRDMNAALVAGLSAALGDGADFHAVEAAMRGTDPFGFSDVPWVERRVDRWLDGAHDIARRAAGDPARLYELLETELGAETWWEAHVPVTVVFAAAETAHYDPLATMQLILEFGHDTDSSLQVAGALFGALHGPDIFPEEMRRMVRTRLAEDYGVSIDDWVSRLRAGGPR
jgi:hypothetical protein